MSHRIEQGNILGYVLVGVVLAALVIGGIFVVRRYLPTSTNTESSTQSNSEDAPNKPDTTNTDASQNSDELKDALAQQAADEKKAQELKAAEDKKAKEQEAANSSRAASTNAATNANNLPATGPEDAIIPMVGATLVTALAVAYVRSRALI